MASTFAKFFPIDVVPVIIPVVAACAMFAGITWRTIGSDPECCRGSMLRGAEDVDAAKHEVSGAKYRDGLRSYFKGRSTGIF